MAKFWSEIEGQPIKKQMPAAGHFSDQPAHPPPNMFKDGVEYLVT